MAISVGALWAKEFAAFFIPAVDQWLAAAGYFGRCYEKYK